MTDLIANGGVVLWIIAALSVATVALILWKLWRLSLSGAWSGERITADAIALWQSGRATDALARLDGRRAVRARLAHAAMAACSDASLTEAAAREETARQARALLGQMRMGLRPLDLIVTIAPLLGLLGTVLGMIAAFQALQEAGIQADPATLAGGIWEALLTTAAGMGVAIPASMALTWFDAVADRIQAEMEDDATRIFIRGPHAAVS
ncbi:Ferric siderophore transport system, biopolymer transport protein ExbB [Roseibacterium elongatum DSM 19469]|uniref:Ferric siderophore transport system, biopolymer transport protein ExbB n=1 Tax=Roseicyclus elongatus DSM 19469 TaxID=1294273 RepID=W8S3T2_9RHOB|nr:MotA/TolQ/ExbB proton channel family protein [Roseibacterium elongatum]AHM03406.1 Ferric siderophore transport system, biopolymer transport protein ExbB [Roseibacterium elongatum DSM 19469]